MNQGRLWCVVSPNVGLPLLIGSVAVTSLIVHYSVLSHVPWMGAYWSGGFKKAAMSTEGPAVGKADAAAGFSIAVTPSADADGKAPLSFTVTVTPNAAQPLTVGQAGAKPPDVPLAAN